jgi:hypothetical protein
MERSLRCLTAIKQRLEGPMDPGILTKQFSEQPQDTQTAIGRRLEMDIVD